MSEETSKFKFSEGRKKPRSWREVEQAVNRSRFSQVPLSGRSIQNFAFRNISQANEEKEARVYFIGSPRDTIKSTLLYIDFSKSHFTDPPAPYPNDYGPTRAAQRLVDHVEGGSFNMSKEETLLRERKRMAMIGITSYDLHNESGRFVFPANGKLYTFIDDFSMESFTPCELQSGVPGGSALDPRICPSCPDLIAFVNNADIWVAAAPPPSNELPPLTPEGFRSHATRPPHPLLRLTHVHKGGDATLKEDPLSAGVPSFVIQEEFDRFTGYWWQPQQFGASSPDRFRILYEETDESEVQILNFADTDGQIESYRYPRAGTPNAKSSLKIAEFSFHPRAADGAEAQLSDVRLYHLAVPLSRAYPDKCEYLVRAGWLQDGSAVWAQVTDRLQNHMAFLLLPLDAFVPDDEPTSTAAAPAAPAPAQPEAPALKTGDANAMAQEPSPSPPQSSAAPAAAVQSNTPTCPYWILYEYTLPYWCEANDLIYFVKQSAVQTSATTRAEEKVVQFLHASAEDGYRHLYQITAAVDTKRALASDVEDKGRVLPARLLAREQLTRGKWELHAKSSSLWIDEQHRLVYFLAGVSSPLLRQLFCVSFDSGVRAKLPDPTQPLLINDNQKGSLFVQSAFVSAEVGCFVAASSSDAMPNSTYVFRIPQEVTDPEGFVKLYKQQQQQQAPQVSAPSPSEAPETSAANSMEAEPSTTPAPVSAVSAPTPTPATSSAVSAAANAATCAIEAQITPPYTGPEVACEERAALVPRPPENWETNDMLPTYFTFQARKPRNWNSEQSKPPPPDGYPTLYGMFFEPKPPPPPRRFPERDPEVLLLTSMDFEAAAAGSDAKQGDDEEQKDEKKEQKDEQTDAAEKKEEKEKGEEKKPQEKYPTVVFVYAGPQIQLVTKGSAPSGLLRLRPLLDLGYCVVVLDSRGSSGRGYEFEGSVNRALGSVEVQDQVECVFEIADKLFPQIDKGRIGFYGWSYGGYTSLMALAQYPEKVKVAVACAPVTNWELYDTGYTERYLGMPSEESNAYRMSSVLSWATRLPAEEGRLLLVHGLQDENVHALHTIDLVKRLTLFGRPYSLVVYPEERHGLRGLDAACHFEVALMSFLELHL